MKGSISLPIIFLVTFIVLKLYNVIDWSWVWVLSPGWISLLTILPITIFLYYRVVNALKKEAKRRDEEQQDNGYKSKWQQKLEGIQSRNHK